MLSAALMLCAAFLNKANNSGLAHITPSAKPELILGERIDGPANMREGVNGKILFILNDHVRVETAPAERKWLQAGVMVRLSPEQMSQLRILPGTPLISPDGWLVGRTIDTVPIAMGLDHMGLITAYTHIDNIRPATIPEKQLARILDQGGNSREDFEPLLSNFAFKKHRNKRTGITQYCMYETAVVDPSLQNRITLMFNKSGRLLGVIHSRSVHTRRYHTGELFPGHKLTLTSGLCREQVERIISTRMEYYAVVD
jgi:hypothetical protein